MVPQPHIRERLPLFVYGTLRPGSREFAIYLAGAIRSIRPATVRGTLWLHPAEEYPFLTEGNGLVHGEIVEVEEAGWETIIAALDAFEDYVPTDEPGSLYLRRSIAAETGDGSRVHCWTYLWNRPELPGQPLPTGDWHRR